MCTNNNNSLALPSCRLFDFPLFLCSFILPSLVRGVYPVLPPSSLFVLITSIEAHTACPQRAPRRDTDTESEGRGSRAAREHSVFIGDSLCSTFAIMAYLCTTISLQHLASDAWFILNYAGYASPDVVMRACVQCVYVRPHVCEVCFSYHVGCRLLRLSSVSSAGLLWERQRTNRSNEDALNCSEVTLKKSWCGPACRLCTRQIRRRPSRSQR